MKFTIESIRKMYQDDQIERERRRARIETKTQEVEGLKSQLAEYGRLGQVEEYVATKRNIRDLEDVIEALQLQEEQKSFGESEAREAWSDIAKDYNKSLDKDLAEYRSKVSGVAQMYADIVKKQLADPSVDVISGLPFKTEEDEQISDSEKAEKVKESFANLTIAEKAEIYTNIKSVMPEDQLQATTAQYMAQYTFEQLKALAVQSYAEQMGMTDTTEIEKYIDTMAEEDLKKMLAEGIAAQIAANYAAEVRAALSAQTIATLATLLDNETFTEAEYAKIFDLYVPAVFSDSSYEKNLSRLGYVDTDSPWAINIYAASFENKDELSALITEYNNSVDETDKINYTDYVAILMSSITLVINAISYVLIAFVGVSLVVSSIMIGIITYISVLERTKEIGILRAIGASKKDISRVFNAETAIVGFASGAIGIGITLILIAIANPILHAVTGIGILNASLPPVGGVILVALSIVLTLIAGLIPSRVAAKKDPVVALRTD